VAAALDVARTSGAGASPNGRRHALTAGPQQPDEEHGPRRRTLALMVLETLEVFSSLHGSWIACRIESAGIYSPSEISSHLVELEECAMSAEGNSSSLVRAR
jgi:hypothetical protein